MAEESKVNITVTGNEPGQPVEIVMREGKANDIKDYEKNMPPISVALSGIPEWIGKRNFPTIIQDNKAIILFSVDEKKPYVRFESMPEDTRNVVLNTILVINPDLQAWGINDDKYFNAKQLIAHIRKYAHTFEDPATGKTLIDDLRNFEVKFESQVTELDNRAGVRESSSKEALTFTKGQAPKQLILSIPIYKDTPPVRLVLDVEIEVEGKKPTYGFFCFELTPITKKNAEDLILGVVDPLRDKFVCLEQ